MARKTKKKTQSTSASKVTKSKKKTVRKVKKVAEFVEDDTPPISANTIAKFETPSSKKFVPEVVDGFTPKEKKSTPDAKLPALTDGLSHYLETIKAYPLLSRDEELKIAKRYHETKDPKDAEILVTSNLRFVVKVAADYSQFGSKLIDLIQEGNIGLMHAVKEFNPYKGARLITYAVWWIKGYIHDYLMKQHSMVKIGTTHNQRKLFYNLEKEKAKIDQMGIDPTVKLLSDRLGVPEKDVQIMESRLGNKDVSLDAPIGDDDSASLLDFKASDAPEIDEQLIEHESISQLNDAIASIRNELSDKELYILETRLLNDEPKKLQEIGSEWGVTREAVRQMEARLMQKIKRQLIASE